MQLGHVIFDGQMVYYKHGIHDPHRINAVMNQSRASAKDINVRQADRILEMEGEWR